MIINEACAINVLLALALASVSVISKDRKWFRNLKRHLLTTLEASFTTVICSVHGVTVVTYHATAVNYACNMFIALPPFVNVIKLFISLIHKY
jgi:hypothetical protein